jgi:hypothetical protein
MIIVKFVFGLVLAAGFLTGCQTIPYQGQARDVKRKPQAEGIVSVPLNPRMEDRARADERMKSNCAPYPVTIREEGEVVVGQEVKASSSEADRRSTEQQVGSLFGLPVTTGQAGGKDVQSSSVTTAVKEWQISYSCVAKKASASAR